MPELRWPPAPPSLAGGGLRLRGWEQGDADAVYAACQDPAIQRWTTVPSPYRPEHASGFVGQFSRDQWAAATGAPFAVAAGEDDRVLGACGLVSVDARNLVAEVGYWVAPWARGQGVARRASRLLAEWAFEQVGFERLELYIEPDNAASCAVAESLGCQREAVLRSKAVVGDRRRDMALYALVRG